MKDKSAVAAESASIGHLFHKNEQNWAEWVIIHEFPHIC